MHTIQCKQFSYCSRQWPPILCPPSKVPIRLRLEWVPNVVWPQIVAQRLKNWHTLTHVRKQNSSGSEWKALNERYPIMLGMMGRFNTCGRAELFSTCRNVTRRRAGLFTCGHATFFRTCRIVARRHTGLFRRSVESSIKFVDIWKESE